MDNTMEMSFRVTSKINDYFFTYAESFREKDGKYVLILDFDGHARNIEYKDCLEVTDKLHELISEEYENTIKAPVKEYMRKEKEGEDASEK